MIQKIKRFALLTVTALTLATPSLVPVIANGDAIGSGNNINTGLCTGATDAAGGTSDCFNQTGTSDNSSLKAVATKIVNIFSILVGIVAVIMIVYGGFRYITSGGSSERVGGAKNTLIYAVIGLVIVALAQFIVHYVLTTAATTVQ